MRRGLRWAAIVLAAGGCASAAAATPVRMSVDEDPIVLRLADSLGYLAAEGIVLERVDLAKISGEDYLMQEPLAAGKIDAAYHWFNHAVFGARHGFPVEAVMMFNDAPGMKVMVANRVKAEIRGPADFRGRRVAEGAGYGTKSVINRYMTAKAGLPKDSYTPVVLQKQGREEAVIAGLEAGEVDVMTFEEPISSHILATGLATTLYDLSSGEATKRALGARFPAQTLLVSPSYASTHADTLQHLVNALVRSMRFINAHDADAIIAKLPAEYFAGKDRAAEEKLIRDTLSTFAKDDYSLPADGVRLAVELNLAADFDKSVEGQWRATGDRSMVRPEALFDNRFVAKAMKSIP